jgi:hypothetical protein
VCCCAWRNQPGRCGRKPPSAGFYKSPWGQHARLQLLTVEAMLAGKTIDPPAQGCGRSEHPRLASSRSWRAIAPKRREEGETRWTAAKAKGGAPDRTRTCDLRLRRVAGPNRLTPPQAIPPDFTGLFSGGRQLLPTRDRARLSPVCHHSAVSKPEPPVFGSCRRAAPPVLGAKSPCHACGACAAGGAPRSPPPAPGF